MMIAGDSSSRFVRKDFVANIQPRRIEEIVLKWHSSVELQLAFNKIMFDILEKSRRRK